MAEIGLVKVLYKKDNAIYKELDNLDVERLNMKKKHGFTLIELLVVISIIALLMSIMMPALGKAREVAKSVVCRSRLKQIGLAAALWAEANNNWCLPLAWSQPQDIEGTSAYTGYNQGSLSPYVDSDNTEVGKTFSCPSANNAEFPDFSLSGWGTVDMNQDREKKVSYGTNSWMALNVRGLGDASSKVAGPGTTENINYGMYGKAERGESLGPHYKEHGVTKLTSVRNPMQTVYFADSFYITLQEGFYDPPAALSYGVAGTGISRWHSKKSDGMGLCNINWVDGHVSVEPDDYADGDQNNRRWWYYLWDH